MSQARDLADGKFDTDTLVVDAANNRVGINTTSMDAALQVQNGDITVGWADNFIGTQFGDGSDFRLGMKFGTVNRTLKLVAETNDNNGEITFETNGSERARVTDNGLTFNGDTAAANALDDYEEGTFTPTLSSSFYSGTLTIEGFYRKIGSMVFVQVGARATTSISLTGSGSSYISNMPFAMENHGSIGTYYTASWSNAYTGGTFGNALAAYGNLYSGQTISMGANQAVNVAAIYFTTA